MIDFTKRMGYRLSGPLTEGVHLQLAKLETMGHLSVTEQKVYDSIFESIILEIVHNLMKERNRKCGKCGEKCHTHQFTADNERYLCPSCSKTFVSNRFAQHLEKCMGIKDPKPRNKKKSESPSKSTTA